MVVPSEVRVRAAANSDNNAEREKCRDEKSKAESNKAKGNKRKGNKTKASLKTYQLQTRAGLIEFIQANWVQFNAAEQRQYGAMLGACDQHSIANGAMFLVHTGLLRNIAAALYRRVHAEQMAEQAGQKTAREREVFQQYAGEVLQGLIA